MSLTETSSYIEEEHHGILSGMIDSATASWDCVATCFFLDTAKNVIEYLEIISKILKKGGVWINLGPLLYHFEGDRKEPSIELPLDQVQKIAQSLGFVFEQMETVGSTYAGHPDTMLQHVYKSAFWVAHKA